jgi:putative zinc finger/helix-turn-helix YgiT family protein
MECLNCAGKKFTKTRQRFSPEVKGEEVEVVVPTFVCAACKEPLMDTEQMNHLRRAAADQYRRKHQLLTSEEIIRFRTGLGMSQTAFAHYLKVGEASIKRWETYYVQEVVQDEHIRLKCDEAYAEFNALEVHWKSHPADRFSGNRQFSWELFKHAVCYLIEFTKTPLFLNKALFYADFCHFRWFGTSITGARYVHLEYGPCPDQYQNLIALLLNEEVLSYSKAHELKSSEKGNLSVFDTAERETLEFVAKLAQADGGQKLLELSHEEEAFKKTKPLQLISYEFSKKLKI